MAREALNYISLFIMITKAKLSGSSRGNGSLGYENIRNRYKSHNTSPMIGLDRCYYC